MSRRLGTVLRLAVGLALLGWLATLVDASAARKTLAAADPQWLAAAFFAHLAAKALGVLRWRTILAGAGYRLAAARLVRPTLVGQFFNQVLPSSIGGDVLRALGLSPLGVPRARGAASVLVDRAVGVFALAVLAVVGGAVGAVAFPGKGPWAASAVFAALVGIGLVAVGRPRVVRLLLPDPARRGPMARKIQRVVESLALVAETRNKVLVAVGWSLGLALGAATFHWATGRAIAIQVPLVAYFVIVPTVMLLASVPITPNGFGVREIGLVAFLGAFGVSRSDAVVFAALVFALALIPALVGGVLFLVGGGRRNEEQEALS